LPAGVDGRAGSRYLTGLDEVDLIVRSPGVRPETLPAGVPVTSVVAEFMVRCPVPVIGVTGTKGKGTTATAIGAILRSAGRRVFIGGNIGDTPLAFLPQIRDGDLVVLELSNFQLCDMKVSPQTAVVLSVTPDHLNWHADLDEYHQAKSSIAAYQTPGDLVVYAADSPVATTIAAASPGRRIPVGRAAGVQCHAGGIYFRGVRVLDVEDVPLVGRHNVDNVAAAVAATYELAGGDSDVIRAGVRSVRALPHRLQVVATVNGVTFVDDSLSTTPETTIAAMAAFDRPQVLILGGSTKGVSFDTLATAVAAGQVRAAVLVGAEATRIATALDAEGFDRHVTLAAAMPEVVGYAARAARPGDVVLLSPACSSVGDFRDYADRGAQFAAAIATLTW